MLTNDEHVRVIGDRLEGWCFSRHLAPVPAGAHQIHGIQHHRSLCRIVDLQVEKIPDNEVLSSRCMNNIFYSLSRCIHCATERSYHHQLVGNGVVENCIITKCNEK